MNSLKEIATALKSKKRVLLSAHVAPDADSIGSSYGLALALEKIGISTSIYYQDSVPESFERLFSKLAPVYEVPNADFDAVVVVDTAARKRVGADAEKLYQRAPVVINIDHHVSNPGWADLNFIDSGAASAGQVILQLLDEMEIELDAKIATCLLAGLIGDTGSFRFSNTKERELRDAARLCAAGASPSGICHELYFSLPERVIRLNAKAMAGLQLFRGGQVALAIVTHEMLEICGATTEDTEGIVDSVRSLKGVEIALFLRELEAPTRWKASLRSKNEKISVDKIASSFGGGGHVAAAGCSLEGNQAEVVELLTTAVFKELETSG